MSRPLLLILIVGPVLASLVALSQWHRLHLSTKTADQARTQFLAVTDELKEYQALRDAVELVTWGARPDADILALARQALLHSGLPVGILQGVTPAGDRPVSGQPSGTPQLREQAVRVTLRSVDAKGLGDFLQAWGSVAPRWTVTSIELALMPTGRTGSQPGGQYTVTLIVTAPYAEEVRR